MSSKDGKEQINCFSAMDKLATCASRLLRGSRSTPGFCSQNIEVSQINRRGGTAQARAAQGPGPEVRIHLVKNSFRVTCSFCTRNIWLHCTWINKLHNVRKLVLLLLLLACLLQFIYINSFLIPLVDVHCHCSIGQGTANTYFRKICKDLYISK